VLHADFVLLYGSVYGEKVLYEAQDFSDRKILRDEHFLREKTAYEVESGRDILFLVQSDISLSINMEVDTQTYFEVLVGGVKKRCFLTFAKTKDFPEGGTVL
jgi:hypothetical protein